MAVARKRRVSCRENIRRSLIILLSRMPSDPSFDRRLFGSRDPLLVIWNLKGRFITKIFEVKPESERMFNGGSQNR
jgi:hypothetical protein